MVSSRSAVGSGMDQSTTHDTATSLGLLALRVGIGSMMLLAHGWGKLANFGAYAERFPDPLGIGAVPTLAVAVLAEALCSLLLITGLGTRFAALPPLATMLTAGLIVHAADPWAKQELPLIYAVGYLTLLLTGAGRFSLDAVFARRRAQKSTAHQ